MFSFSIILPILLINFLAVDNILATASGICYEIRRVETRQQIGVDDYKIIYDRKPFEVCCENYTEVSTEFGNSITCEPTCNPKCSEDMFCVSPGKCECKSEEVGCFKRHYMDTGRNCSIECPANQVCRSGECMLNCAHGGYYRPDLGTCSCQENFAGLACESCANNFYGPNCEFVCNCNGFKCNRSTGACSCPDLGYYILDCEVCPPKRYGLNCSLGCDYCQNGAKCSTLGGCLCDIGYYGDYCENECDCENGYCHGDGGACICFDGWGGDQCAERVCQLPIINSNRFKCHSNGTLICKRGFIGEDCEYNCPPWQFGDQCAESCICERSGTIGCDTFSGVCKCKSGNYGDRCHLSCGPGQYLRDNQCLNCACTNGIDCDRENGACLDSKSPRHSGIISILILLLILSLLFSGCTIIVSIYYIKLYRNKIYKIVNTKNYDL